MSTSYPYASGQSTLMDARTRLNIYNLWHHFNYIGQPSANCRSPWREDHKPSFSVSADGILWNDFATGEGGDAVDFFQRASGLSQKEACKKFIELAGGSFTPTPRAARPQPKPADAKPRPTFPDFRKGTPAELAELARTRGIGVEGLEFASERGLLVFDTLMDCAAWIVTDSERANAQARRMDGKPWEHLEGHPNGRHRSSIGFTTSRSVPKLALV